MSDCMWCHNSAATCICGIEFVDKEEIKSRDKLAELEAAVRALLEWDKRYPKGAFYTYMDRTDRYSELTALIERFRALLEPITSEDK